MPKKKPNQFLYALVTWQDMTVSGNSETYKTGTHLSIEIIATVSDGAFKDRTVELHIFPEKDFDGTEKYVGGLYQCKPAMQFVVKTDIERFGHIVTLTAAKAIKEVFLSFEAPYYGKAKVMSWQLSTAIED